MRGRYLLGRLVVTIAMALAATLVVFVISHFVPVDPVKAMLGDLASSKPELVAAYRHRWGLDLPVWRQYLIYLANLLHGNLGISIQTNRPVINDILRYAPATFELSTFAAVVALALGIPLGVLAAIKRDTLIDHTARVISLVGVAAPTFWLAYISLAIFYGGLQIAPSPGRLSLGVSPPPAVTGMYTVDSLLAGQWGTFLDALAHMVLPGLVLASTILGLITRTTRASMLETLGADYIRTARAKGLRERAVIFRHALRNALVPVVTLSGVAFAQLLTGTVLTETIFSWPGLGRYAFQSALALDVPAITGITLLVALIYLIINFLVDFSYVFLDPRMVRQ